MLLPHRVLFYALHVRQKISTQNGNNHVRRRVATRSRHFPLTSVRFVGLGGRLGVGWGEGLGK